MNIAIVGCGYVAEQYAATLRFHPELRLVGRRLADDLVQKVGAFKPPMAEKLGVVRRDNDGRLA